MTDATAQLTPAMCELAELQYGMITRAQAEAAGDPDLPAALVTAALAERITETVIRLRAGARHPYPDIYAAWLDLDTKTAPDRDHQYVGIASHSTALVLYGLTPPYSPVHEFTSWEAEADIDWSDSKTPEEPHVYWSCRPPRWQTVAGIPTTTPTQTLFDLAPRLDPNQLNTLMHAFTDTMKLDPEQLRSDLIGLCADNNQQNAIALADCDERRLTDPAAIAYVVPERTREWAVQVTAYPTSQPF